MGVEWKQSKKWLFCHIFKNLFSFVANSLRLKCNCVCQSGFTPNEKNKNKIMKIVLYNFYITFFLTHILTHRCCAMCICTLSFHSPKNLTDVFFPYPQHSLTHPIDMHAHSQQQQPLLYFIFTTCCCMLYLFSILTTHIFLNFSVTLFFWSYFRMFKLKGKRFERSLQG